MAHPKATTVPPANNGKRRPNRRQSLPASGETIVISTCRGMKARPATSVGRCAPRIITNGIKVSTAVKPCVEECGEQVRADDRSGGEEE